MDSTVFTGVGVTDLQRAAVAEARRYMREAKGDRAQATRLVYARLVELGWITDDERGVLLTLQGLQQAERPGASRRVRLSAGSYGELRAAYHRLLATGGASPVALVLAAGAVGAYEAEQGEDEPTVVYAANTRNYQGILGGAGAIIGGAIGGGPGAALGGAIGGVIGTIVDDCKD